MTLASGAEDLFHMHFSLSRWTNNGLSRDVVFLFEWLYRKNKVEYIISSR